MKKFQIIIAILLCSMLICMLVGCDNQSTESKAEVSINNEASMGDISEDVSEDISEDVSEDISEDVSEDVSEPEESVPDVHTHIYADSWKSNETDHWKECECGDKSDIAIHSYGEWTVTKEATEETEGSKYHDCLNCGYRENYIIPVLSHTHSFGEWVSNATSHWKECKCGEKTNLSTHNYGDWTVTKEATCTTEGARNHTCNDCSYNETASISKVAHSYGSWKSNGTSHWKECKCGNKTDVAGHNYGEWTVTKEATEESEGSKYHSCKTCGFKETSIIPVLSHTHSFGEWVNNATSHWKECKCGDKSSLSSHTYGEWTVTKEATCTAEGVVTHICTDCDYSETDTIDALDHIVVIDPAVAPTCTTDGKTEGKHCSTCNKVLIQQDIILSSHTLKKEYFFDKEAHWYICSICQSKDYYSRHDFDDNGYCRICGSAMYPTDGVVYLPSADGTYAEVVDYTGSSSKVKIASEYEGLPVKRISDYAFKDTLVRMVYIPDSVTSIGDRAFSGCKNLWSITIPNSVTNFGEGVFVGCNDLNYNEYDNAYYIGNSSNPYLILAKAKSKNITACVINEKTRFINYDAFGYCRELTNITIPDGVTNIDFWAFRYCSSLTSVTIPDSVTSIGQGAFEACSRLTSITLPFVGGTKDGTTNRCFSYIFTTAITFPSSQVPTSLKTVVITGETSIGEKAFYDCYSLTSITIGNSVTNIGDWALGHCTSLTSITIPDSVASIGDYAFFNCKNLKNANYSGTEEDWAKISIGSGNSALKNATIHYNYNN